MLIEKKARIKQRRQETKEKRKKQVPTVVKCKLQNLSKAKLSLLERLFLEVKWLYNWTIADIQRVNLSTKDVKEVEIKVGNRFEKRELNVASSQIKQGVQDKVKEALKSLKKLKENNNKVGKLKFKSKVNSIYLKQYGITYVVDKKHNRIKIQGLGTFRVLGLRQITDDMELTSAFLIRKPDGYYLHVTCYRQREKETEIDKPLAIDFGIENKLTFSNGIKIDFEVPESKRLKRLQQLLERKQRGSKNRQKIRHLIQKEHLKLQRIRKELHNKVIALAKHYKTIIFQNDDVKAWHEGWFGRAVQHSGIGGIMQRLKNSLSTPVSVVERYQITSKLCANCKTELKLSLSDRQVTCPVCGYVEDRDINACKNMLSIVFGKVQETWLWLTEQEVKLIERLFSTVRNYIRITTATDVRAIARPTVGLTGSYALKKGSSSFQ